MRRSAKQPDRTETEGAFSFLGWALQAAGEAIARNPLAVGGCTAFLVTLSYVSANALWYQPHFHDRAFFSTRHGLHWHAQPATNAHAKQRPSMGAVRAQPAVLTRAIPATPLVPDRAGGGATQQTTSVLEVQAALTALKYYNGPIDGLTGPQTKKAIADFQKASGLTASGNVDAALLGKLKLNGPKPAVSTPTQPATMASALPQPRPVIDASVTQSVPADVPDSVKQRNIRIQAGLKAFGNDDMELDGVIGPRTKAAIREFQSLFGLPATGEPDDRLLAKMRSAGLTN